MSRRFMLLGLACLALGSLPASSALAQALTPNNCAPNSVLPTTHQLYQETNRWMGVAVSPQNPSYAVHLEQLADALSSHSPPVVSDVAGGTNFALRNFAGQPDAWVYAKAFAPLPGNAAYVAQWDPGSGALNPGASFSATYGGLALGCELLRVFDVYLTAGQSYAFTLTTSQPADDVKLALVRTGSRPGGWVTRPDALFEQQADPEGAATPHVFTAPATGNYGLAVFVDDLTAFGGVWTVGCTAWTPPANLPDLVVASITPATAPAGTDVSVRLKIRNIGTAAAAASTARFRLDNGPATYLATPALAAGDSALLDFGLGTMNAGVYTLQATADYNDTVSEANEDNNTRNTLLTVSGTVPTPDLVIMSLTPASAVPNQPFTVAANVHNRGTAAAPASVTRIDVTPGWAYLDLATPPIAAGATIKIQGTMAAVPAGAHDLRAAADWTNLVAELNETNNVLHVEFMAEGPDLVVESISPLAVTGNVAPIFTVTIRNQGNGAAAASAARLVVDGRTECTSISTPSVPAGGAVAVQCTSGTILSPGSHAVEAWADYGSAVPESDESNNHLAETLVVTPSSVVVNAAGTGDYPTIQAAVDAVAAGGEVLLAAGTYTGPGNRDITFGGKDVTVTALPGGVTINCQGDPENERRAFRFVSGEGPGARIIGLTIINGWSEFGVGGGILVAGSAPTIEDCVIRACHADRGGAIAFSGNPPGGLMPHVLGCTLTGNSANLGAAVFMDGPINVVMDNVLIASNFGFGGAVGYGPAGAGTLDLNCCDLWANGGGDYVGPAAGQLGVDGNISRDPLFCNAAGGDHHVAENSPCAAAVSACGRIGALDAGCGPKGGTVRLVNASGTGQYLTVQHAINNSVDGDVVELADGLYSGTGNWDISTLGKAIVIRSASGDPLACAIDGQRAHRGFVIDNGEGPGTVISGIGVTNGLGANGGAILCSGSSPLLENLYLSECHATVDGGGLACLAGAAPVVRGCTFELNTCGDDGGGMYGNACAPVVQDCVFTGNRATNRGGGACFSVGGNAAISGSTFTANVAVSGGGLAMVYSLGAVSDNVFTGNTGSTYAGGIYSYGNDATPYTRCTIVGNTSPNGAGVYLRQNASPVFSNCIVAFGSGGAGFARFATDCNPTLTCTDVWGNAGGDWTAMIAGQGGTAGNLWADPLFCDRAGGDLTLRADSPCTMANSAGCGQIGALGIGCTSGARNWWVAADGSGDLPTIQAAIDAAQPGDTVLLGPGTFTGAGNRDIDFRGKAITVRGQSGGSPSIIDCQGSSGDQHRGFYFHTGEGPGSVLAHVTVTGGHMWDGGGLAATGGAAPTIRDCRFVGNTSTDDGGGVFLSHGSSPRLVRCEISGNDAVDAGGGMYAHASVAILDSCIVADNRAGNSGGGLYTHDAGSADLDDCVISGNWAGNGGGVYIQGPATSALVRVRFTGNTTTGSGGGLYERNGAVTTFDHCEFGSNTAGLGGAVASAFSCRETFTACTFVGNSAADGAVIHGRSGSTVDVIRGLLVFSPAGAAITSDGTATFSLVCTDVYGNAGGDWTGPIAAQAAASDNFSADPVFCDRWGGDHSLASVSPCLPARSPCGLQVGALGEGCALSEVVDPTPLVPAALVLDQNIPNPFNPVTTIVFATPRDGSAEVAVYSLDGRRVAVLHDGPLPAGRHELVWRARDDRGREAASGVYLVRVRAGGETQVRKMTLMR